jgi:hypothetical protein
MEYSLHGDLTIPQLVPELIGLNFLFVHGAEARHNRRKARFKPFKLSGELFLRNAPK